MKLDQLDLNRILKPLYTYRILVIWVLILGLLGFTLIQARQIADPQVDESLLEEQRQTLAEDTITLELNAELESRMQQLQPDPIDASPDELGSRDPFNP